MGIQKPGAVLSKLAKSHGAEVLPRCYVSPLNFPRLATSNANKTEPSVTSA